MSRSEKNADMKPNILELIDLEKVNLLLEGFQKTTGFVTAILDLEGNVLCKSGWRQMCTEFHRINPESSKKCTISDTTLANKMNSGEKIHFYKCLNGLIDVAVPIIVKEEHIANLFSGQFLLEEPDVSFFEKQADEFGFNSKEYLKALEKVPVVSKEKVQTAMEFLLNVTQMISDLAFQKLEQTESNKALKDSEDRYLAFINASNDMIFLKDEQFRYIVANNAMASFFGMEKEEMIGKTDLELANKDKIFPCISSDKSALEASAAFTIEEMLGNRRCETTKFPVNLDNNQKGIGGIIRDITDRNIAEAALRESEERFTLAMKASNDGLFDWNLVTNDIYYSPRWKKMLGYEDHELPNDFSVWENTTEPEDVKKSWKLFHELILKQTDRFVLEFRMKHKDGHWVDILSRAEAIFDNNGKAIRIVGTHSDISGQKHAEQALISSKERAEESEKQFRQLFENMEQGFALHEMIYDDSGKPVDYRFVLVNKAFEKLTGIEAKSFLNKTIREVLPETEQIWIDNYGKVAKTGIPLNFDSYAKEFDKYYEVVAYSPKQDFFAVVFNDITKSKQYEKELVRSEKELKRAQEITHIGSWSLNLATNEVIWSEELYKMYGFDPTLPPPPYTEHMKLFTSESWELLSASLARTSTTGIPYELELRTIKHDGSNGWMWVRGESEKDEDGNIISLWGAAQDITERKRIEEQLSKAKERAEESDRLKSAFLANMSHEIRTPMNGILGFADLLKNPELSGNQQQEYIQIIEKSGIRMLNIINDIVDISKIEAGLMKLDIKESNINEQVEYIYTFFKPEVEAKGIKLIFNNTLPANEAIIKTDREKLYAILTNLVKNAIKYTEKGSIEFGYDLIHDPKVEEHGHTSKLLFYVKDTGSGVPKDRQEAIFERFVQADISDKMAKQGAGLGLSISKAYAEMLDGRIWVESDGKTGSAFYIELPYNIEQSIEIVDQQDLFSDDYDNPRKLKILIAEDDEVSEMLLNIEVKSFCREIVKARTGFEAVEACRNNPDTDLILMDIRMPEMDGYEATRQIRGFNKEVIIIAQTAYGLSGDREKAIESGCNDYIAKPIYKADLLALVKTHFRK